MDVVPRKAAACIVMRDDGSPEVLMGRRNESLRFMAGHYCFPGGRVDDNESIEHVVGAEDEAHAHRVHAVAREVFEETGLLCAVGEIPDPETLHEVRLALLDETLRFEAILERFSLKIHAEEFEPAGTWVTPKPSPIRFDTQYFLHRLRTPQQERLIEGELTSLDWMSPAEARSSWRAGNIKVSTPVAFALQQLAFKPYPEALRFLSRGTERAPGEHSRFEIRCGITIIPLVTRTIPPATHTNCIIIGEKDLFVIDPGADDEAELTHLRKQLDHFIDLGAKVQAVVLTHSHRDHIGGVALVRNRYDAPVWAHEATSAQVDFPVDRQIQDGERLVSSGEPDWVLRAIHTPGHDPGHLCFLEESSKILIAGDMVAGKGTIVVSHEFGGNMNQFLNSFEVLLGIDSKIIIPAHGQPEPDPHKMLRKHRDHRLWREQKIKDVMAQGITDIDELLAKAYDDAPKEALPLARHALNAHIARIEGTA